MIASTHDLPPRGNYFAEHAYLTQNLERGTLQNRAGARLIAFTDEAMLATLNTLERELGDRARTVIKAMGLDWGRRAAEQFSLELEVHYGRPLSKLPLAQFVADLTEAFRRHGWGKFTFDVSRYTQGLLIVEVTDPFIGGCVKPAQAPVDGLLAAFLAGMLSHFAGVELDGVQTHFPGDGHRVSRFILTTPVRVATAETLVADGRTHEQVIDELAKSLAV